MTNRRNNDSLAKSRIRIAELAAMAVCLLFTGGYGYKYIVSPLISPQARGTQNTITYDAVKDYAYEGDIVDKDGAVIMSSYDQYHTAYAYEPECYSFSYLLGYYTVANGRENTYGLRGSLADWLLFHLDDDNKGATVTLTVDKGLQDYAYTNLLAGQEGSITVIDNKTGAIRCLTSRSTISYNVNDLDSFLSSDVEGAQFRRGTYENDPPGSTFKILTAAAAIEKDEEENLPDDFFTFTDTGSYTPAGSSWTITNWNDAVFGTIDLDTAFKNSVNCYFADLGIRIGQDRLLKTAQAFRIGKDIEIPFLCTLHSKTDLGDEQPVTIAQTAFGQGNTEITPVHLALIAQAVANDGVMLQPYVVSSVNSGNMPLYRAFPHKLGRSISHAVDVRLKELMHHAAENYGLTEDYYGMVYAKSGTAECANDRVHTYIVGFTEDASFCVSMNNGHASADLYGITQELVAYINRIYGR